MSLDERLQPVMKFAPEIASLNMGSMNFGLFPMLDRYPEFKHSWEREHLGNSRDLVFKNTFADIERILSTCRDMGTRFEFECYDVSTPLQSGPLPGNGVLLNLRCSCRP